MKKLIASVFTCCITIFAFSQIKEGVEVTDMVKIKSADNISFADNGSKAVFTVQSIEPDTARWEYKYITQIWLWDANGTRQVTFAKEGASQPALSPDGRQLVFVRTVKNKPQVFLLDFDGGEAVQVTDSKYGATNPVWSKNGTQLLYTANVSLNELLTDSAINPKKELPQWPFEKPGFTANSNLQADTAAPDPNGSLNTIRKYLSLDEKDNKAKVFNKLRFQEESVTSAAINFSHIYITSPVTGAQAKPITHGFYSFRKPGFLNDSIILLNGNINEKEHPDRSLASSVYTMNINTGDTKIILSKDSINYTIGAISSSGKWLAYTYQKALNVGYPVLAVMPADGNETEHIDIPVERNISAMQFSNDDNYLYINVSANGAVVLKRVNLKTKKTEELTGYNSGVTSFALGNDKLLFSLTEVKNPSEVYVADLLAKNVLQVTQLNTGWLQSKQLSFPEKHSFTNNKGMVVEYWVMKPINYETGKKYPLLLEIHGGPTAMWGPGETSMWHEYQYFCSKGYGVVYCNPRGSSGYSEAFLRDNIADWGDGPTSDVLTALDNTVAEGWASTSKLLVTGGSYAGYLVAWIVGHDHRFKAACSQRGVYDLSTFFGEGNAWNLVPMYFGGYPWQPDVKKLLDYESPITYVNNITTPYIIFHGETDLRTGVIQSEMMYKSLKVLGRPVEYVRHPGATHELTRSGNNRERIDQMLRTYEFFERYIHP